MYRASKRTMPFTADTASYLLFEWHSSTRHDPDNVAFAKKFILDGLQAAGVLENDNRKFIGTMADEIIQDDEDYVILHITENMGIFL